MPRKMQWKTNPELIDLMIFLIEKCKDAQSPLAIRQLTEEFIEKRGSSQGFACLESRIKTFRSEVHRLDSIDTERKVRMMFALGASIGEDVLNELQKDADVEVDGKNRITKYISKNGSLNLEGDHSLSARMKEVQQQRKLRSENSQEDSGDGPVKPSPKTPGSVKRSAVEVPSSSKRTKTGVSNAKDSAPDDSARVSEFTAGEPRIQKLRQPKLEEAPEVLGANSRQETPGAHTPQAIPIKTEPEADDACTPQIKLLGAMKSLIFPLDMPSLSPLRTRIQKKFRELSSNEKIPNDEMSLAMGLMVAKITNHSVQTLPGNVESVRLSHFLCYLKAAIVNSELEGLKGLLEKISERIKEPPSNDKNIPLEKLVGVLQDTLNNIGV